MNFNLCLQVPKMLIYVKSLSWGLSWWLNNIEILPLLDHLLPVINSIEHILLVLILFIAIFNVSRVTLITVHLQKIYQRKLSTTQISKAQRHVPD